MLKPIESKNVNRKRVDLDHTDSETRLNTKQLL